jgi:hypothetical protein
MILDQERSQCRRRSDYEVVYAFRKSLADKVDVVPNRAQILAYYSGSETATTDQVVLNPKVLCFDSNLFKGEPESRRLLDKMRVRFRASPVHV